MNLTREQQERYRQYLSQTQWLFDAEMAAILQEKMKSGLTGERAR